MRSVPQSNFLVEPDALWRDWPRARDALKGKDERPGTASQRPTQRVEF